MTQIAGYPTVFAHGIQTMGLTSKMLTNYVGAGRLTKFGVRFTNQHGRATRWMPPRRSRRSVTRAGQKLVDLKLSTTNQDGKEVVSGSVTCPPGSSIPAGSDAGGVSWADALLLLGLGFSERYAAGGNG